MHGVQLFQFYKKNRVKKEISKTRLQAEKRSSAEAPVAYPRTVSRHTFVLEFRFFFVFLIKKRDCLHEICAKCIEMFIVL